MRCDNETLISKITQNKLNKLTEVSFNVLGNLPDCKRINTKYVAKIIDSEGAVIEGVTATYNKHNRPNNAFECMKEGCVNTGTLYVGNASGYAVYRLPYDATKFAAGIVTFYVTGYTGAKNVTFKISSADTFADADVYTVSAVGTAGEFTPVVIDLSQTPTSVVGNGWEAGKGAYVAINVADANAGISSIAIFDSIEDFEINDVVKVGCLTEIGGDIEINAAEDSCNYNDYDTSDLSFERTITGTRVSANYHKLNPLLGKGDATEGFELVTLPFTVEADGDYGKVVLPDAYQEECGYIMVSTDCYLLTRYDIPVQVALDEDHFQVIKGDNATLYFNKNLVGKEVLISYPRAREVEELVANEANIGSVRTRMIVPWSFDNGEKGVKIYDHVLVTTFPDTINEDDTEFSFTITVKKDIATGHYFRIQKFVD